MNYIIQTFKFGLKFLFRLLTRVINLFLRCDKNLILFHNSNLLGYNDNAKYLFEYLSLNSDYKCIWVTKNIHLHNYLISNSFNSVYHPSIQSIFYYLRCSVCVSGETLPPDGFGFLNNNAYKISLSHGYGPRSTNSADGKMFKSNLDVVKALNKFNLMGFSSNYTQMLIGRSLYLMPSYKTYKTGMPRCDQLLDNENVLLSWNEKNICKSIFDNVTTNSKIYLYAPTWRNNGETNFPLLANYENQIYELNKVLKENNSFLIISAHPLSPFDIDLSKCDSIKLFKDNFRFDISNLLKEVDCLISDYSSIITDFTLLDRDILFYMPDYDYYFNYGLNEDFINNLPGLEINSLNDFLAIINGYKYERNSLVNYNFLNYKNKYYDIDVLNSSHIYLNIIDKILK